MSNSGGLGWFDRWFFLFFAFLLIFIPSAIRYDIGTDYLSYIDIFENKVRLEEYKYKEPGFYFVNWFLSSLGMSAQWAIAAFAFIFTTVTFKTYKIKNAWLLNFLFMSVFLFFSFNGVRQAVSISFVLLALFCFFDKRYVKFIIYTVVGSLFHQSAILIAILGAIALIQVPVKLKEKILPYIFIALIFVAYFFASFYFSYIENILNILGFNNYTAYFNNLDHFRERDFGSGLGILAKLFFSIYIILNTKHILMLNKNYWLIILMVFLYGLSLVLTNEIIIFMRMSEVFVVGFVLSIFVLYKIPYRRNINLIIISLTSVFLFLTFLKMSIGTPDSYNDPKTNPYQTIFSSEIK